MKSKIILSAITFFLASQVQAQTNDSLRKQEARKLNDIKLENKEISEKKAERGDRKQDASVVKKEISQLRKKRSYDKKELRKLEAKEVGISTQEQFYRDFPKADVLQWERSDDFKQVTFNKDRKTMTAYYDADNKLIGTTMEKSFTDLPGKAQSYISNNYSGFQTTLVIFFDDNEQNEANMNLYNQYFDDADNYFVELAKNGTSTILKIDMHGNVSVFK